MPIQTLVPEWTRFLTSRWTFWPGCTSWSWWPSSWAISSSIKSDSLKYVNVNVNCQSVPIQKNKNGGVGRDIDMPVAATGAGALRMCEVLPYSLPNLFCSYTVNRFGGRWYPSDIHRRSFCHGRTMFGVNTKNRTHHHDTFLASELDYKVNSRASTPPTLRNVPFGAIFTPHMFLVEHSDDNGWGIPKICPFGPLELHPATQVLHYGMTCFEGMKAYKGPDGHPYLFRPERNMDRLLKSVNRLQLAPFCPNELLKCIKSLIKVDQAWIPDEEEHSLYIRPFAFSSSYGLGVAKAKRTTVSVILSPVGPYFPTGLQPIRLFIDEKNVRAWPGGGGAFKIGGNYAPTILPQVEAAKKTGSQQVLYTLKRSQFHRDDIMRDKGAGLEAKEIEDDIQFEECGAMNIFFLLEKPNSSFGNGRGSSGTQNEFTQFEGSPKLELVTPKLQGTILPGVTRESVLELVSNYANVTVSERNITLGEIRRASSSGRLREIFGTGTACVIQPVKELIRENGEVFRPSMWDPSTPGALVPTLYSELLEIQYGKRPGHPWSVRV